MIDHIVFYPILNQLLFAIVLFFCWRNFELQRIVSIVGSFLSLFIAINLFSTIWNGGTLVLQSGNWQAPFGITFVADMLAATLVLLTAIVGLSVSVFSVGTIRRERLKFGYFPVFHFLLLGLNGAFLTGDIFNLYVWFEMIIISSFVLLTLGGEKQQLEAGIKYFTLNILASVLFLTAIAVLYGLTGTLNMADAAVKVAAIQNRGLVEITALLFFAGFGIKAAVFPMYFWLPASYHTPPTAISAIFGGLLTKLGVYALIRTFTLIFYGNDFIDTVLIWVAAATLFSGALGALTQNNITKIFSYLIICHIGFMILGLGLHTEVAIAGTIFYLIHDIIVKSNIFMVSGLVYRITGTFSMRDLGGLYAKYPILSLIIIIPLFSLVGIPPLSGFWPKLSLITESISIQGNYFLIGAILFATFITLFVIARFWTEVFWKKEKTITIPEGFVLFKDLNLSKRIEIVAPIVFLAGISLFIGFGAESIHQLAIRISGELLNHQPYIDAVLKR